jgi:hypothetical protein
MKTRSTLLGALAIVIGLAACGDDSPTVQDGSQTPDGPGPAANFTAYVIDLVKNHTDDPTPAAFSDFMSLPDPDGDANNVHAYDTLFQ